MKIEVPQYDNASTSSARKYFFFQNHLLVYFSIALYKKSPYKKGLIH